MGNKRSERREMERREKVAGLNERFMEERKEIERVGE